VEYVGDNDVELSENVSDNVRFSPKLSDDLDILLLLTAAGDVDHTVGMATYPTTCITMASITTAGDVAIRGGGSGGPSWAMAHPLL
jgi:hypothetical protein